MERASFVAGAGLSFEALAGVAIDAPAGERDVEGREVLRVRGDGHRRRDDARILRPEGDADEALVVVRDGSRREGADRERAGGVAALRHGGHDEILLALV